MTAPQIGMLIVGEGVDRLATEVELDPAIARFMPPCAKLDTRSARTCGPIRSRS